MKSAHLYGRHLVVEAANEEEGVEEIRKRTVAQFVAGNAGDDSGAKRAKVK